MRRLKGNFYYFLGITAVLSANCPVSSSTQASAAHSTPVKISQNSQRFIKLDDRGQPLVQGNEIHRWNCVLDTRTGLRWEVKTRDGGLQDASHSFSWYVSNRQLNGGFAGYPNHGICPLDECNTQSYIDTINRNKLCNISTWRLPTREELRSLVDYQVRYPGPVIDHQYFPNTLNQFYWSSVPDANDRDSAWGIGFSFGYDYAYFKSDQGRVRLVSESSP